MTSQGCRTCRKRHQKCDERKPTCWNCRWRGIECGGYGIKLADFTVYSGRKGQMVSRMMRDESDGDQMHPGDVPADGDASSTPTDADRPPSESLLHIKTQDTTRFASESHSSGDDTNFAVSPGDAMVTEYAFGGDQASLDSQDDEQDSRRDMEDLCLRLYPIKTEQNPYRIIYGSLAAQSEPLRKAILFASALHRSKLGKLPTFAIKHYRTDMQESFRSALCEGGEPWNLAATALLSALFDIIGTGMNTWSSKLIGCRRLLQLASLSSEKVPKGFQCVVLQYNWAATMSQTLLKGVVPADTCEEIRCIDEVPMSQTGASLTMAEHQSHWWDNLPDYQMHLFLRQATEHSITIDRLRAAGDTEHLLQLMPRAAELVNMIQAWQPHTSTVPSEYLDSVLHFNEVWRLGMLCFVHSEVYGLGPRDRNIQRWVEASLEPIRKLSWLQACLFPLFMIALHAENERARQIIRFKLGEMHATLGFQGPLSVASVLVNIWMRSDGMGTGKVQWREAIREMGMELNILL
ncbi:hypothetical protein P170DRAFT_474305 [Aspergillus steynii IBT 23096]|uniref:Zn(2)-C6 fungal-type domain-containing protein n=1 Tax=Aspergillus steynii IBT 23096 TaxID=1392250 RepID=A0A2I2GCY8_9EURO|nr:uncharacterized protein P170DRAFT_474305 [Aspergillus steynii IBT 23096]PLB50749.1 hypothetical protein P170DRAFT_474305 [Aspergillus steynii IBT 23096]